MNKLTAEETATEMDKFEAWFVTHRPDWNKDCIHRMSYKNGIGFASGYMQAMWTAWKARASLELALPVLDRQSGWIDVTEKEPNLGWSCFVWMAGGFPAVIRITNRSLNDRDFTHWMRVPDRPKPKAEATPQIDNDGWIEWKGGTRPIETLGELVEVKFRSGLTDISASHTFYWKHTNYNDDIIAYRVIENDGREG